MIFCLAGPGIAITSLRLIKNKLQERSRSKNKKLTLPQCDIIIKNDGSDIKCRLYVTIALQRTEHVYDNGYNGGHKLLYN
jgi:hypothetical protein